MLQVSLISPDKKVWTGAAQSVTVPTETGYIQILNNHVPLVSVLRAGEVTVKGEDGETHLFAVSQGVLEVREGNQVVVLANTAEPAYDIDAQRAETARARAQEAMAGKISSETEFAAVMGAIEKEMARVKVAIKHKQHR